MCLGVPGKIIAVTDRENLLGTVEVSGIQREVNLSCVTEADPQQLIGRWALIHVGFAMCLIDEAQAKETLAALTAMQALEHEVDDFSLQTDTGK